MGTGRQQSLVDSFRDCHAYYSAFATVHLKFFRNRHVYLSSKMGVLRFSSAISLIDLRECIFGFRNILV